MLIDKVGVLLKKNPRAWYFRSSCFRLEVRSTGKLKTSQCFFGGGVGGVRVGMLECS